EGGGKEGSGKKRGLIKEHSGGYLLAERINLFDDSTILKTLSEAKKAGTTILATGNVEDGELPPEVWETFGLRVRVESIHDIEERIEILRRVEAYKKHPTAFYSDFAAQENRLRERIARGREIVAKIDVPARARQKAEKEGKRIRADAGRLLSAAVANAALDGRNWVEAEDVEAVLPLVAPPGE
ncbi:MAG: hypothetical protein J7L61_01660, partial [Thermoplasmata archaeon]|nr:hypothetical protein [Thermoplasmata archaeon]